MHASSFQKTEKYCKIVETGDRIPVKRRKGEPPFVFYLFGGPLPHPHKSPYSCSRGSRGREDANTSYLTSSRQIRPSPPSFPRLPPSLFLPGVEQAAAADSVVVSSSHKAALSPSTTPSNAAPSAAGAHKNTAGLANHFCGGEVLANEKRKNKSCKVTVRDTPA